MNTRKRRRQKRSIHTERKPLQESDVDKHRAELPRRPAKLVKITLPIVWCVFSVLAFLVLFELTLRLCGYGKDTRLFRQVEYTGGHRGWETNPDVSIRYFFRPPHENVSFGDIMHYCFIDETKPAAQKRVFFLGASTIYGMPPPHNLAIPRLLETLLDSGYPKRQIQVVNCGVTALNSHAMVDMVREILPLEPDAIVLYSGHNEFYGPYGMASSVRYFDHSFLLRLTKLFSHTRMFQMARRFAPGTTGQRSNASGPEVLFMELMVGNDRIEKDSRDFKWTMQRFEENLKKIASLCVKNDVPLILCTVVSNKRDCAPLKSVLPKQWNDKTVALYSSVLRGAWQELLSGQYEAAERRIEEAKLFDTTSADVQFLLGRHAESTRDDRSAAQYYRQALENDGMRFRAPKEINATIRNIAAERGILLADIEQVFRQHAENGLLGLNLFWDHVHPNTSGKYLLASTVAEVIVQNDCLQWGSPSESLADRDVCLEMAGYTPVDDFNALEKMILFHRFYPMNAIMNCDEVIEQLSSRKDAILRELEESYSQALRIQMAERERIAAKGQLEHSRVEPLSHQALAGHLFEAELFEQADREYRAAIRSHERYRPELPNLYTRLVLCINRRKDLVPGEKISRIDSLYHECRKEFERFASPNASGRLSEIDNMALLAFWAEDYAFAIPLLQESVRLKPSEYTFEQLIRCCKLAGKTEQAREYANSLLDLFPENQLAIQTMREQG